MPTLRDQARAGKRSKRDRKADKKQAKQARKQARREAKLERKLQRQQQQSVLTHRALLDRSKATTLIEELLDGLKSGRIIVSEQEQQVTIEPAEVVDLRVRARQSWKTEGLTIRVRWQRATPHDQSASLQVSSGD